MDFKLRGNGFVGEGKLEEAVKAYSEGIVFVEEASPAVTEEDKQQLHLLFSNRAQCHIDLGDLDSAIQDIEQSIEIKDDFPKAYVRRAAILIQLFKYSEAKENLTKAESMDPSPQFKDLLKEYRNILSGKKWVPNAFLKAQEAKRGDHKRGIFYELKDLVSDEEGYFDHVLTTGNIGSGVVSQGAIVQEKYCEFFRSKLDAAYRSGKPSAVCCVRHCIIQFTDQKIKDSVGGEDRFAQAVDQQLAKEYGPWFQEEEAATGELKKFFEALESAKNGKTKSGSSSVSSRNPLLNLITQSYENQTKRDELIGRILAGEFNDSLSTASKYKPATEERALDNWSPVHEATRCEAEEILSALLKMGANPNIKDKDGETPLFIASSNGAAKIVEILCGEGKADVQVKADDGWSCIMQSSRYGHVDTVETLCRFNAPVTGPGDMFGRQALDLIRFQMAPGGPLFTSDDDPKGVKHKANLKKIERILLAAKKRGL